MPDSERKNGPGQTDNSVFLVTTGKEYNIEL